uniref:Trafficking protein particle complex subunit n=1 Tax=Rhabditophanes sp. KR3021 TaxID=114890 RepID=A0AC35THT2_9BILA
MTIYNFYLYNNFGKCIYYKDFQRCRPSSMDPEEEFKLMFGMIFSLNSFSNKLCTKDGPQQLKSFTTSTYKMFYIETLTGYKLILNTSTDAADIHKLLHNIYTIFAEVVVSNMLIHPQEQIECHDFDQELAKLVMAHPCYPKTSVLPVKTK